MLFLLPNRFRQSPDPWLDARKFREVFERSLTLDQRKALAELLDFWERAIDSERFP